MDDEKVGFQKRSYPNSFGGQYQLKGYELVEELRLLENAPRIAGEAVALHQADRVLDQAAQRRFAGLFDDRPEG